MLFGLEIGNFHEVLVFVYMHETTKCGERSGRGVECLTGDRGAAGSSLTGVTALWSLSKIHLS